MKKYKYEIMVFLLGAIYMILELVCSRMLAPYFGTSNLVWTSVIGIVLLSSSLGNYIGGHIADKEPSKKNIQIILACTALSIFAIGIIQKFILSNLSRAISDIKIGAIISTIILFFLPSMLIGFISPIAIKLKIQDLKKAGKTSGILYALSTLGSIIGTFAGGFVLIPLLGSVEILYLLSLCICLLILTIDIKNPTFVIFSVFFIILNCIWIYHITYTNIKNRKLVLDNKLGIVADYDTVYGRVNILNTYNKDGDLVRYLMIDKGAESSTYLEEGKEYELSAEYTRLYDLMFKSNIDIKDTLMIGGARIFIS